MKLLLVRASLPGALRRGRSVPPPHAPPLGAASLASAILEDPLTRGRVEVKILDCAMEMESISELPPILHRLRPDMVGISAMIVEEGMVKGLSKGVKAWNPGTPLILGGPFPSTAPQRALSIPQVDFIFRGEGERAFPRILRAFMEGGEISSLDGVGYREDGRIHLNPPPPMEEDLDRLPSPALHLIPIKRYGEVCNFNDLPVERDGYTTMVTSRGCVFDCIFCHNLFGRKIRARSPERVVSEMEMVLAGYGIREFHIVDDIFNYDGNRLRKICRMLIDRGLGVRLAFPNGVRGDLFREEEIKLLKKGGCYSMTFAVETCSERLQRATRKNLNLKKVFENARIARDEGIITQAFIMLGFPDETEEEILHTGRMVAEGPFDFVRIFIPTPHPGTELYQIAVQMGIELDGYELEKFDFDRGNINLTRIPGRRFMRLIREVREDIYSRPERQRRIDEIYRMLGHPRDIPGFLGILPGEEGGRGRGREKGGKELIRFLRSAEGGLLHEGWRLKALVRDGPGYSMTLVRGKDSLTIDLNPLWASFPHFDRTENFGLSIKGRGDTLTREKSELVKGVTELLKEWDRGDPG